MKHPWFPVHLASAYDDTGRSIQLLGYKRESGREALDNKSDVQIGCCKLADPPLSHI